MTGAPITEFPLETFREAALHLRRPYTASSVRWKVQAVWPKPTQNHPDRKPTSALVVGYLDARLVVDRLNLVVPHLWTAEYEQAGQGAMWCHLTIGDITRRDIGNGQGKGLISDALKRAAIHFGIGVSLSAIPKMILSVDAGQVKLRWTKDGDTLEPTPQGRRYLIETYQQWLNGPGRQFGEALDHGDADDSQGDETDQPEEVDAEIVSQPAAAPPARRPAPVRALATKGQIDLINIRARAAGVDEDGLKTLVTDQGVDDIAHLSVAGAKAILDFLEAAA